MFDTNYMWPLKANDFIRQYYIQGPFVEDFNAKSRSFNQLRFEAEARTEIAAAPKRKLWDALPLTPEAEASSEWNIYYEYGNDFIELSDFYSTLKRIDLHFYTRLFSKRKQRVKMRIWSYMAVELFLNRNAVATITRPVYKPIQSQDFILELNEGLNVLYGVALNLGVRDTRNIVGIQLLESSEEIFNCLEVEQQAIYHDIDVLGNVSLSDDKLKFSAPSPGSTIRVDAIFSSPDFYFENRMQNLNISSERKILEIPSSVTNVEVHIENASYSLSRFIEINEHIQPSYSTKKLSSIEENFQRVVEDIASVKSLNRGRFGFSIMNILARKYCGNSAQNDKELFLADLDLIEKRVDCSDFLVAGLIRYVHNYELDDLLADRTREVLLNYRYWMDMEGADGMCFWSENHSLMFYTSALFAGELYPDDFFTKAGMTGRELAKLSEARVKSWLNDVEDYHLEEFLSADYSPVTIAPLLNLVDFAEPSISNRASAIIDSIVEDLARHSFKGSSIAPMGRVYRSVIYPFKSSVQSLVNWINPAAPTSFGEGWLAHLATSKYKLPQNLDRLIQSPVYSRRKTGNAVVVLDRNESYCLTSVESPRFEKYERWPIVSSVIKNEKDIQGYVKSLNERFHGTTNFTPGIYGYQQHLWYAALTNEAILFVNHPGTTTDVTGLRPGYWFGNGIIPAIKQSKLTTVVTEKENVQNVGVIGSIYKLSHNHPIEFTHVFCPLNKFSESLFEKHWIFLAKDKGFLALWSSGTLIKHNDVLFDCEFRVTGRDTAYLCFAGSITDFENLSDFASYCKDLKPYYDVLESTLICEGFVFKYEKGHDETQYVK
ncbi:MAG: hypothetical protein ACOYEA_08455 [Fermentimonas sp.]|jgi:hypothetical protein